MRSSMVPLVFLQIVRNIASVSLLGCAVEDDPAGRHADDPAA